MHKILAALASPPPTLWPVRGSAAHAGPSWSTWEDHRAGALFEQ